MECSVDDLEASSRKSAIFPGVVELQAICNELIDTYYPAYRFTTVELELHKHGHRAIWGVPNRPIYMGIELLWAYSKRHVNMNLKLFIFL